MSSEMERASAFIKRLLRDPALSELTPLQKEQQIIQLLHSNSSQLYQTLSHSRFFPGKSWSEIEASLQKALFYITDDELLPGLRRIVYDQIDFSFVNFFGVSEVPRDRISDAVYGILTELLDQGPTRRALTGPYTAAQHRLVRPYVDSIYTREHYIHFELTRVQRLRMSRDELKSMVEAAMLLKPALHLQNEEDEGGPAPAGGPAHEGGHARDSGPAHETRAPGRTGRPNRLVSRRVAEEATSRLCRRLPLLPEQVVRSAANANVSFKDNRFIEATSRLVAVFASRGRNYRPNLHSKGGAEPPDKSWLSVARRNHSFYGFDVKMLDELYSIAAEKGW